MEKIVNCAKCCGSEAKENLLSVCVCEWPRMCVALATITLAHSLALSLSLSRPFFCWLLPLVSRLTHSNYVNFNAKVNATCCMFALLN